MVDVADQSPRDGTDLICVGDFSLEIARRGDFLSASSSAVLDLYAMTCADEGSLG